MKIPRRVWSFYRIHPRLGVIEIGWRWDVARYGIAIGLGLREKLVEGEIRWRWWWTWSPPELRLVRRWPPSSSGIGGEWLARRWTGRAQEVGLMVNGRIWWWA